MTTIWPCLHARDARALIAFLEAAFGFEPSLIAGDGDRVDHAELLWPGGGGIMLGSAKANPEPGQWVLTPGTFGAYLVCDDPAALFARAVDHGAIVLEPLATTPYDSLQFSVLDPEGNHWSFGTYTGVAAT